MNRTTPKIAPSRGNLDPIYYMVLLAHPSQFPKRHLDRFSSFCRAQSCAQQTDRQTVLRATSVAIGRICAVHAMRPNKNMKRFDTIHLRVLKN